MFRNYIALFTERLELVCSIRDILILKLFGLWDALNPALKCGVIYYDVNCYRKHTYRFNDVIGNCLVFFPY